MDRVPVTSTVIATIAYDPPSQTLEVEFHTGRIYQYFDVTSTTHRALMTADSVGRYYNRYIRNRFPVREVE